MADNKTKNTGRFRRTLFRLMGQSMSKMVIHRLLRKKIDRNPAALPSDLNRCSDILFILPVDRVEMIFQLENLFAILGRFKNSNLTFICPAAHSSFVSGMKNVRVIKFNPDEFSLYSAEFNRLVRELTSRAFDICVMLERDYSLAHLYLIGMSRAHLRVGWGDDSAYPFLNIRLVSVPRENVTLWERNLEAAKILSAETGSNVRWGVQKSTADEVTQLLNEHRLKKEPALVCVDLASLKTACGGEWCADLLKALKSSNVGHFYIFGGTEEENAAMKDAPFPVLAPMSIPKTAALLACTTVVITGPGALLGLAQISSCRIVPTLTKEQAALYCKQNNRIMPALFAEKPDAETVKQIQKNVRILVASATQSAAQPVQNTPPAKNTPAPPPAKDEPDKNRKGGGSLPKPESPNRETDGLPKNG
jgi:ADP-heptose:LPS heptosyltransferase